MKILNEKGLSVIEVILTFTLVMVIVSGILTIIFNYKQKAQVELKRLELVTYKNTLTKEIQTDILDRGIYEINTEGLCKTSSDEYSNCVNLVFKDGIEKILAISKLDDKNEENLKKLLNNKYIKYGDTKYPIEDKLPAKIPENRSVKDFQNIYINSESILTSDSVILENGNTTKIYAIDIYMEHIDYEDDFGIHIVASDNDTLSTSMIEEDFTYTGNIIDYVVPANGTYKLELWGASGGDQDEYTGGQGAYVSGYTYLTKNTTLYLYIGGAGGIDGETIGGYNGGSNITSGQENYGSPGGGATDIRTVNGNWNDFNSLKSRIIVAAGGGGANNRNKTSDSESKLYGSGNGGAGGGLTGYTGEVNNYKETPGYTSANSYQIGTGGTQDTGGNIEEYNANDALITTKPNGGFGKLNTTTGQSGAGGGWFTGGNATNAGAGGGSSYISGHNGCKAINQSSTENNIQMKEDSEFDGYHFDNTTMIDGAGYSWTDTRGNQTQMPKNPSNSKNGHIKITYLGL